MHLDIDYFDNKCYSYTKNILKKNVRIYFDM